MNNDDSDSNKCRYKKNKCRYNKLSSLTLTTKLIQLQQYNFLFITHIYLLSVRAGNKWDQLLILEYENITTKIKSKPIKKRL